jgi:hypothetical protein
MADKELASSREDSAGQDLSIMKVHATLEKLHLETNIDDLVCQPAKENLVFDFSKGSCDCGEVHGQEKSSFVHGTDPGSVYRGMIKHGLKHGTGIFSWSDGRVYHGQWSENLRHGDGTMTWPDGNVYDGQWVKDKQKGSGEFLYSDGSVFYGEWVGNKKEGAGLLTYADGSSYQGQFFNDLRDGKGVFLWPDGDAYDGQWRRDLKYGHGVMTVGGHQVEGEWENDIKTIPLQINNLQVQCSHALWSSDPNRRLDNIPIVQAVPKMAEYDLDNAAEVKGKVVAIIRGQVNFADKVGRAVDAGAVGVIVINNDEQSPHELIVMGDPENQAPEGGFDIPAVAVSHSVGRSMIKNGNKCSLGQSK